LRPTLCVLLEFAPRVSTVVRTMNGMLRRWMWLVLSSALTACASVPLAQSEEGEDTGDSASFEEWCQEEGSLVPLCDEGQCGLYRCREVAEELTAGRVMLARTGGAVLPGPGSSAQRYWGSADGLPKNSNPVFIIPWGPKRPLLPSQQKMVEELEAEWRLPHEKHHIFPQEQELKEWFAIKGINIHEFTMLLPVDEHRRIHHPPPKGGDWNEAWRKYKKANPNVQKEEIYRYAGQLIYEFKLAGPVVPYYRQWTQPPPIGG
jgi:uncharacterized lipoprotein (TIGR02269 family)